MANARRSVLDPPDTRALDEIQQNTLCPETRQNFAIRKNTGTLFIQELSSLGTTQTTTQSTQTVLSALNSLSRHWLRSAKCRQTTTAAHTDPSHECQIHRCQQCMLQKCKLFRKFQRQLLIQCYCVHTLHTHTHTHGQHLLFTTWF